MRFARFSSAETSQSSCSMRSSARSSLVPEQIRKPLNMEIKAKMRVSEEAIPAQAFGSD